MSCNLSVRYAGRRVYTTMHKKEVDTNLNPRVVALKLSKTMALTDLASSMRERGMDVVGLAAGEPDFDTPSQILDAGIEALRWLSLACMSTTSSYVFHKHVQVLVQSCLDVVCYCHVSNDVSSSLLISHNKARNAKQQVITPQAWRYTNAGMICRCMQEVLKICILLSFSC